MSRTAFTTAPAWPDPAGFSRVDVLGRPAGHLNLAQRARLGELADQVRLVHDLIIVFADRYAAFPDGAAAAQMREVAALRDLLDRYRMPRRPGPPPAGRFAGTAVQAEYDRLLALGITGRRAAIQVVSESLRRVLVLLDEALPGLHAADVHHAYAQLYSATIRQLSAMQEWSPRQQAG